MMNCYDFDSNYSSKDEGNEVELEHIEQSSKSSYFTPRTTLSHVSNVSLYYHNCFSLKPVVGIGINTFLGVVLNYVDKRR